jgi:hypothetical protein
MSDEKAEKFAERYKRLSTTEFREIMGFYHSKFPDWKIIQKNTLVRENGPIVQGITIERLSGGEYRPTGHIHVIVTPSEYWFLELPQNLKKMQSLNRRQHREFKERVVETIRRDFVPKVDEPLIVEEVLKLYEHEVLPTSGQAYSLAPWNAYLGYCDRALYWCARFKELIDEKRTKGLTLQDFDYKNLAFINELEKWIKSGNVQEQLERVLQEERRKWGLADN